ncbi:ectonucleotide pyrophosphatase/phosphodiesterase [Oleiagrimonas sp. C23AA]|uniref:alkaline phosphatase family protein n=1 Tax=Oleiagrimonas sp. C23AA TaxID=2719047 RepID=UPI00141F0548|nr:ectonucleotide pyrophosphatase/phosphodiesterase [Oleiagrimonas sp. C23AA]NII09255.1 alkaline phosphatase family protein [Oleiagrimonas sp. C23AA]
MRRFARLISPALALLLAACAGTPQRPVSSAAHGAHAPLLLISIDAFRPDYLDRGKTPTLNAMAASGVRAKAMQPSFPSLTFPNHYTLVTGLYPDHHGIVNNNMYDPALGKFSLGNRKAVGNGQWWAGGEPIWVTADKHGLQTATMFWPGSGTVIHGYRPDHFRAYDGKWTPDQRVDQVLKWLSLPAAKRPDFLTLYFDRVDHAGHTYGPDSPQVNHALKYVDDGIARLVAGLKARGLYQHMNIIVVSDHGMASTPRKNITVIDKLINLKHVRVVSLGVVAGFIPKSGYTQEVEKALLGHHDHMTCWRKQNIPARYHYGGNPRVPAITCAADLHWQIMSQANVTKYKGKTMLGDHGYDNAAPQMRALFIAHGPAFRQGAVIGEFPNVDVYPLMTHLLGLPAQTNDGHFSQIKDALKASQH